VPGSSAMARKQCTTTCTFSHQGIWYTTERNGGTWPSFLSLYDFFIFFFLKKRNLNRFSYLRQALETLQGIHSSFVPKATQRGGRKGAGDLSHPMEDVLRLTKRKIGLSLIRKMKVKPKIFRGIKSLPRPHFHALRVHQKNKGNK